MSADLLRRAATKLREHASAVEPGPWDAADDGLVWPNCIGDPVSGSVLIEDARYIALMHPPVALALAELLDLEVKHWDASRLGEQTAGAEPGILTGAREDAVHALARAILREPKDGAA